MAVSFVYFFVVYCALAVGAQSPSCPDTNPTSYCSCYPEGSGFWIECEGDYATAEKMSEALTFYQSYALIVRFDIIRIKQNVFNYVPDDFLVANQISSVSFQCNHYHNVNDGLLMISVNAFKDSFGECGLTGNLTFRDCNLRQFDAAVLNNCHQLKHLAFVDSHVESLIDFPTLKNLQNFTVYSPRQWTAAPQRGLSRMALAPGASLPLLSYLDLTGNSLEDDSVKFVSQEASMQEMHLEGNHFFSVPNLTNCLNLHTFSTTLDISSSVSIQLPDPREQLQPLEASFYSSSNTVHEVTSLRGMFGYDVLNLKLDMTRFDESVFLGPLLSSNLIINLNSDSKFLCGCNIAWLVRDNRQLLNRVRNGFCADGTAFESIPEQELSGCLKDSRVRHRIDRSHKNNGSPGVMVSSRYGRNAGRQS
ncbi:uncharacterized protein LOC130703790 [Daphnia carinata]|uniref:uncharacterized protein LOC130703790 n=1 Tax=Daphnia carinata TaxID=120202 RepID=UPI002580DCB6|nr:uncharacterized protein LOC130703790 [Daphnia carinata]